MSTESTVVGTNPCVSRTLYVKGKSIRKVGEGGDKQAKTSRSLNIIS